jgi:hypothetical protein
MPNGDTGYLFFSVLNRPGNSFFTENTGNNLPILSYLTDFQYSPGAKIQFGNEMAIAGALRGIIFNIPFFEMFIIV